MPGSEHTYQADLLIPTLQCTGQRGGERRWRMEQHAAEAGELVGHGLHELVLRLEQPFLSLVPALDTVLCASSHKCC